MAHSRMVSMQSPSKSAESPQWVDSLAGSNKTAAGSLGVNVSMIGGVLQQSSGGEIVRSHQSLVIGGNEGWGNAEPHPVAGGVADGPPIERLIVEPWAGEGGTSDEAAPDGAWAPVVSKRM